MLKNWWSQVLVEVGMKMRFKSKKKGDPGGDMLLQLRVRQELGSVEASAARLCSPPSPPRPCTCSCLLLAWGSALSWDSGTSQGAGAEGGVLPCVVRFRSRIFLGVNLKLFEL